MGAALIAPARAMAASDTPAGQGRSSSDVAILLLLAVLAVETRLVAISGWMMVDGDWGGAITVFLVGARQHLTMPIVLLLGASVFLTVVAGRRRRVSDDFDLVSIAIIPLVFVELLNSTVFLLGADIHTFAGYVGYAWALVLLGVAFLQTRKREYPRKEAAPE